MTKVAATIIGFTLAAILTLGGCTCKNAAQVMAPVSVAPGVYKFGVGNSLYPKSRGASIGFQRHLNSGEEVTGSLEWEGNDPIRYKWSLYIYDPDGSIALEWNGADLKHEFHFTALTSGTYKIEILKRDFPSRDAQLVIDPPSWNRWGG